MTPTATETRQAILADDFARTALQLTRDFLYANYRDWELVSRSGVPPFTSDQAFTLWNALCDILGNSDRPDPDGKVCIGGGVKMKMSAIYALDDACSGKRTTEEDEA